MRVQGHEDEGSNIRMHDGPTERQRITGRSRWGRNDYPVGVELAGRLAVNRDLHPDQVDVDAFVDDRVVQGMKDAIPDSGLEQGPPLEAEVTRRPAIERAPLLTELHLGEEAEASGIDPEHRNIGDGRLLGGPEHRPIAADTDDQSGAVEVAD